MEFENLESGTSGNECGSVGKGEEQECACGAQQVLCGCLHCLLSRVEEIRIKGSCSHPLFTLKTKLYSKLIHYMNQHID